MECQSKLLKPINKKPFVILVNVEIIQQSIVNSFDEDKHILVEQKDQNIFLVIKNRQNLVKMFNELENLARIYCEGQLLIVAYSSKRVDTLYERLAKVNKYVADNMHYFDISQNKYSTARPNRAFISTNNEKSLKMITYGEGYSQIKPKQQLRLALQCAINMHEQNERFFIIQTQKGLKQQEKDLKKQGYKHMWTVGNFDQKQSLQVCFNRIFQQSSQNLLFKMEEQSIEDSYYLKALKSRLKQAEFKDISSNIQLSRVADVERMLICPIKQIHEFLSKPKKSFTPVPKSSIRSPGSKQICSLVFKNVSDHKLYIAKSSAPKDIGGLYYEEKIQNRCFIAMVGNLFTQVCQNNKSIFYSLPLDKAYCMMKYSLLKNYETKKACVLIKPYLQNLACLEEYAEQFVLLLGMQDSPIYGFGQMMFWSLVSGECFKTKTLLQQVSLVGSEKPKGGQNEMNNKIHFISKGFESITSFIERKKADSLNLLRVDYFEPFSASSEFNDFFAQKENSLKIPLTRNYSINIEQLNSFYLREIYQLAALITCQGSNIGLQIIKGLAAHYKWEYDKSELVDSFFMKAKKLQSYIQQILESRNEYLKGKQITSRLLTQLTQSNPLALLLFMPQDYGRFIKPPEQDEKYFGEFFSKISLQKQNQYVTTLIQKSHSFQIYGNCPSIYSLPNWVRSLRIKYRFIEYISMLNSTKEDFILIGKRLKIMAANEKNNALLIVDHAQLCEDIIDEAKNVRTVFISRFKKGEHEIQIIYEEQNQNKEGKYLQDSNDELIIMLMELYERYIAKSDQKCYLFERYQFVLENYMKVKCQQYGFSYPKAREFCLQLHKNITQSKNRFKEIQQRFKQNEEWKLLYVLPVEKKNQKVTFIKNLHSFIDVLKFVQLLTGEKKKGIESMIVESKQVKEILKINPKLLPSLKQWEKFIEPKIKNQIIQQLICYVTPLASVSIKQYLPTQREADDFALILQVLEVTLSPYKSLQNKLANSIEEKKLLERWNELYYSLFPEQQGLFHFSGQSIINLARISSNYDQSQQKVCYMIQTDEKLSIYHFNPTQQKCEKQCEIDGEFELMNIMLESKINVPNKMEEEQNEQKSILKLVAKQKGSEELKIFDLKTLKEEMTLQDSNEQLKTQIQLTVKPESQELIITCLAQKQQSSIKLNISNLALDEQILDFQIIKFVQGINYRRESYFLMVIMTYNVLVYKIKFQVDNINGEIKIKQLNEEKAKNIFNINNVQNKGSMNQFLSLVNYNQLSNKEEKAKTNEKRELSKSFVCTINKLFLQGNISNVINVHLADGLKYLVPKNKNSPIIQILKPVISTNQQLLSCVIVVLLVNKVSIDKEQQSQSSQHNPFLAFINLRHQSSQISLIPLFDTKSKQKISSNQQFKVIHEVEFKQKQINSEKYLQSMVYYSLENVVNKETNFSFGLIHYPKVVNTMTLMIPYKLLLDQSDSINEYIIYDEPKTHIIQNVGSSQKDGLFIMPLQQAFQKESYMLTIQGTVGSTLTEKSDTCIRLWKLNNI